ncbi:MAG: hypothetical protein OET63_14915 [Desulfobacterales bacterium]|jgi:hypothetical protein|nr:hypothetical protein [Desulfobacterales bacterium]
MINVSIDTHTVEKVKRELINQLKSKINQTHVEKVCREQYGIKSIEGYECIDGDIVIDNNQIAFKLDFEVRFPVSILIDNVGNNSTTLSEEDDNGLSEFDNGLEEIEPQEIDETIDEELPDIPDIDLKD